MLIFNLIVILPLGWMGTSALVALLVASAPITYHRVLTRPTLHYKVKITIKSKLVYINRQYLLIIDAEKMQQQRGGNLPNQGRRTPSSLGQDGGPAAAMHPNQQQQMAAHMQQQQQMDGRFPGSGPAGAGSPFGAGVGPKMGGANFMDMNSPNGKSGDGVSPNTLYLCSVFHKVLRNTCIYHYNLRTILLWVQDNIFCFNH